MKFVQKAGFQTRSVELQETGVHCTLTAPGSRYAYDVQYENVIPTPIEFSEERPRRTFLQGFFLAAGTLVILSSVWDPSRVSLGVIAFGGVWVAVGLLIPLFEKFPRRQLLQMSNGDPAVILFAEKPSENEVADFIKELTERAQEYLRQNYGSAAPYESKVSQIERLAALLEKESITPEEYESLKAEIITPPGANGGSGQYI